MFFIYRLTDGEQDYYGQTENPKRRFGEHKAPSCRCRSKLLDKSKMKLHIIHRLYTQEEADETEAFYQLNFECVNKLITGRTKQEYLEVNKEKRAEKFYCDCGSVITIVSKTRHLKTKKHQNYISSIK